MPVNIEIKARAYDFKRQSELASGLSDGPAQRLRQEDTFFNVPSGRLKLREFGNGTGEMIQYHRPDRTEPAESSYIRSATTDPSTLKEALTEALGVRAVVKKQRTVYVAGQTRIHLDEVEGLGEFLELEVVLGDEESAAQGKLIAGKLMERLEIDEADLVSSAYVDLLESNPS